MNATVPSLHATIKLHKPNISIRTIINWKKASAYELAKYVIDKNTTSFSKFTIYIQCPQFQLSYDGTKNH
jgi:hypothetical protein